MMCFAALDLRIKYATNFGQDRAGECIFYLTGFGHSSGIPKSNPCSRDSAGWGHQNIIFHSPNASSHKWAQDLCIIRLRPYLAAMALAVPTIWSKYRTRSALRDPAASVQVSLRSASPLRAIPFSRFVLVEMLECRPLGGEPFQLCGALKTIGAVIDEIDDILGGHLEFEVWQDQTPVRRLGHAGHVVGPLKVIPTRRRGLYTLLSDCSRLPGSRDMSRFESALSDNLEEFAAEDSSVLYARMFHNGADGYIAQARVMLLHQTVREKLRDTGIIRFLRKRYIPDARFSQLSRADALETLICMHNDEQLTLHRPRFANVARECGYACARDGKYYKTRPAHAEAHPPPGLSPPQAAEDAPRERSELQLGRDAAVPIPRPHPETSEAAAPPTNVVVQPPLRCVRPEAWSQFASSSFGGMDWIRAALSDQ